MSDKGNWTFYKRGMTQAAKASRERKWFCDACQKEHGATVDRVQTTDDRLVCWRQFVKGENKV